MSCGGTIGVMKRANIDKFQSLSTLFYPGGSMPKPALNNNFFRLYQHNLCPYCCRARYAFAAKMIPYQNIETDLNNKAPWHLDFNGGFAPILETPDGEMMGESGILM